MIPPMVGLDVGGTFLKAVVIESGRVVEADRRPVPAVDVLDLVEATGRELLERSGAPTLGVGVAGLVSWPNGEFVWGPHVTGEAVPYRSELEHRLGVPVVVDNDANLAAYAEAVTGAGRDRDPVLMVTFGTGIGGGLVIGGGIYRGRSFAGEVGHMVMVVDGPACACGGRGCWETLVSGAVLDEAAQRAAKRDPHGAVARLAGKEAARGVHLSTAAQGGDAQAIEILEDAGRWLGRGLANLIVTLDPEVVVIGGAMADAGELVLGPARAEVESVLSGGRHRPPVPIVRAEHGELAGAVGAAWLSARSMEIRDDR